MPAAAPRRRTGARRPPRLDADEPIRGVRRNMVRTMAAAHAEVVPTTLMDDADLHAWAPGEDIMARLIRALVRACAGRAGIELVVQRQGRHAAPPFARRCRHRRRFARRPVRAGAAQLPTGSTPQQVRAELNRLRDGVKTRSLPPEDLHRLHASCCRNFGVFAGKYATPVVVPPCVCIVGAGRLHHAVVPVLGGIETHRLMPLSLTFDHRAATGGEAARFLRVLIDDLQRPA